MHITQVIYIYQKLAQRFMHITQVTYIYKKLALIYMLATPAFLINLKTSRKLKLI